MPAPMARSCAVRRRVAPGRHRWPYTGTMDATAIALSGMRAAQARLDGAAHNIANVQTEGFQRLQVRSEAQLPAGGVRTRAERVPVPGADLAADLVEQKQAAVAFAANGQVVRREQQMLGRWLDTEA